MFVLAFAESIQLFPDGTMFIHIGLILIMIYVLNRTLYKPLNKVIEAREKNKGGHSSEAVEILASVQEKESHYNQELLAARSSGYELIEASQTAANAKRADELSAVKTEISTKYEAGRSQINKEATEAKTVIGAEAEKMADSIAASILKK